MMSIGGQGEEVEVTGDCVVKSNLERVVGGDRLTMPLVYIWYSDVTPGAGIIYALPISQSKFPIL